jgi:hypothetical protein
MVGQRQIGRAGLQHVDQVLGEILRGSNRGIEASERSVLLAAVRLDNALLVEALSMKSVPEVRLDRPRPAELKVTPVMFRVDLPVSNTRLS